MSHADVRAGLDFKALHEEIGSYHFKLGKKKEVIKTVWGHHCEDK